MIWKPDSREDLHAPASHRSEDTWPQIPGWVDGVARVKAHRQSNDQNHKAHSEGLKPLGYGVVVWIHNGQDAYDQGCRSNELWWMDGHT